MYFNEYIIKQPDLNLTKINDAVMRAHQITIHGLMFIKLYLLDHYNTYKKLPEIDHSFVVNCLKIVCVKGSSGRPPSDKTKNLKPKKCVSKLKIKLANPQKMYFLTKAKLITKIKKRIQLSSPQTTT